MPAVTYPTTLPAPSQWAAVPRERRAASSSPGNTQLRNRSRDAVQDIDAQWFYTSAEMVIWRAWYETTLLDGMLWFAATVPGASGWVERVVKFRTKTLKLEYIGNGLYRVSAQMQQRGISEVPSTGTAIEYLVVAGGGSGGGWGAQTAGGGGGAGGMLAGSVSVLAGGVLSATVGAGGAGGAGNNTAGLQGGDSVLSGSGISTVTALGGGLGGFPSGGVGGSGGGTSGATAGGPGTGGQGNAGGTGTGTFTLTDCHSGAGGGAGAPGSAGATGEDSIQLTGATSSITGASVTYAAGGHGNLSQSSNPANSTPGPANTGNGGGGCKGNVGSGGAGGSGVVILRMLTATYSGTVTGSPTVTTDGDYTVIKFTGSGTYTH